MSTLEDINKKLKEANEGNTDYADLQQELQLKQLSLLEGLNESMKKVASGEASGPVTKTPFTSQDEESQIGLLSKIFGVLSLTQREQKRKNKEDAARAKQAKRSESVLGKDFGKGVEEGNVYKMGGDLVKNPFVEIMGKFKMFGAQLLSGVGKMLGIVTSIFSLPTAIIIGTIGGLMEAFKVFNDTEGSMTDKLVASVEAFVSGFFESIGKVISWVADLIPNVMRSFGFDKEADEVEAFIGKAKVVVAEFWESIKEAFSGVKEIFETAAYWVEDNWEDIKRVVGNAWETVKSVATLLWDGMKTIFSGLKTIFTTVKDWVVENWDTIKAVVDSVWDKVKLAASGLFTLVSGIFSGLKTIFTTVKDWVVENWDTIKATIDAIWDKLKLVASGLFTLVSGIFSVMKTIFTTAKDWITENWDTISSVINTVWESVKVAVSAMWEAIKIVFNAPKNIFDAATKWFSETWTATKEAVDNAWESVKEKFNNIKESITSIFNTIKNIFENAVASLKFALSWEGVKATIDTALDQMGKIGEWIGDLAKQAWGWVKNKLMFWKKDAEAETLAVSGTESVEELEKSGAVKKEGTYGFRDVVIEPSVISNMSDQQLIDVAKKYPKEKKLQEQVMQEQKIRAQKSASPERAAEAEKVLDTIVSTYAPEVGTTQKVGNGNVAQALNSAPVVPIVVAGPVTPSPASGNITGLGYESVGQSANMQVAQKSLNETKTVNDYSRGGDANVSTVSSNMVNNYTSVYSAAMPSAVDTSDRTSGPMIYR